MASEGNSYSYLSIYADKDKMCLGQIQDILRPAIEKSAFLTLFKALNFKKEKRQTFLRSLRMCGNHVITRVIYHR